MIVVGGPNGAGKTTLVGAYREREAFRYLGADAIAYELRPEDVASVAVQAGRMFLERLEECCARGEDVIVETTLSGRSFQRVMQRYRAAGYDVELIFISLASAAVSAERVAIRVGKGGHDVPDEDIQRRFLRAHWNFWNLFRPLADDWQLLFNGPTGHQPVAKGAGDKIYVANERLWLEFSTKLRS